MVRNLKEFERKFAEKVDKTVKKCQENLSTFPVKKPTIVSKRAEKCQPKSGKDILALQCYSCYS